MYRLLLTLWLFACSLSASAADQVRDMAPDRLTDSTWVIHGPLGYPSVENQGFMNNPAFIITDRGVVVIDPGSSLQAGRMVLKQIRAITDKPVTHVFNTHVHGDHWLGNHAVEVAFPNVKIYGHPDMITKAEEGEGERWIGSMERSTDGFTRGTRMVLPKNRINHSETVTVDNKTFRIYAPDHAHSGTDIMIEVVEDSVFFTGDNITHTRFGRLDDATFKGNIEACLVAIDVSAKYYVPGHGKTGGREIPENYKLYLETLYREAGRHYEDGLSDYEMKPMIVKVLAPYSDWVNFHDEVGRHINRAILEYEQRSFE
ncbi:MAG: MBL fold metallo-hydrolase [Candidatus Sedimenticola sp. (ex Thyasira tokunagai)]